MLWLPFFLLQWFPIADIADVLLHCIALATGVSNFRLALDDVLIFFITFKASSNM